MIKGVDYTGVAVGFACHDGAGNYLFSKRGEACRDYIGTWELGGGAVRFREKVEDCLLRELQEELSVTPLREEFMGYHDLIATTDGLDKHWIAFNFMIQIDRNLVKIGEPEKCDEVAWHTLDDLPGNRHPGCDLTLKSLRSYLNN